MLSRRKSTPRRITVACSLLRISSRNVLHCYDRQGIHSLFLRTYPERLVLCDCLFISPCIADTLDVKNINRKHENSTILARTMFELSVRLGAVFARKTRVNVLLGGKYAN